MKLAVVLPGIGYHKDKPLLYYSTKIVKNLGYEVIDVKYGEMPQKIRGNAEMMKKAAEIAYRDAEDQLGEIDFSSYEDVVFIGKSMGTYTVAKFISVHGLKARQIWYTPVEYTFEFNSKDVVAFIGDADPWSDVEKIKKIAEEQNIKMYSYPNCNHSLECDDVDTNIEYLRDVMKHTKEFLV